jgi:MFS family permease
VLLKFVQPSIEIWNLRIDEPITTATDLLMAGICFYAFFSIRHLESRGKIKWYFKYYFLTLGLGALFGGLLGHAFLYRLSPQWKLVSWIFTLLSVALMTHALFELSRPLIKPYITRWLVRLNGLILAVSLFFTLWTLAFSPVKLYSIFGMVVVVGSLSYIVYHKTGSRGVVRFMFAVGLGIISALIFSYEWGLSPWFNHNDISHVILSFSALIIYKGALLVMDTSSSLI